MRLYTLILSLKINVEMYTQNMLKINVMSTLNVILTYNIKIRINPPQTLAYPFPHPSQS